MHVRLEKLIEGPDTMDYVLHPEKVLEEAGVSPKWGDAAAHEVRFSQMAEAREKAKDVPAKKVLDGKRLCVTKDDPFGGRGGGEG